MKSDFDARWSELGEEVMQVVKQWRLSHPKASFNEIEQALDEPMGRLRARMLEDVRIRSRARRDLVQFRITPGVNLVLARGGFGISRSRPMQKADGHPRPAPNVLIQPGGIY